MDRIILVVMGMPFLVVVLEDSTHLAQAIVSSELFREHSLGKVTTEKSELPVFS